ncbi:MAG TPA: LysR family transcriptional regulator [Polyangiaceae bacterium]|nr:LysR family transcriptional regulator [Polyangiaceae bacterium]
MHSAHGSARAAAILLPGPAADLYAARYASMADLADLNLNLLLALDALLSEANVTRAAERLGVTQPAMSRSLQKLREQLGDELLVRSGRGLVRTPRAERIRRALGHGLQSLRRALAEDESFEPARATTAFRVAANDVAGVRLLPALMEHLRGRAPHVAVNVVPLDHADLLGQFEFGALDLALGVSMAEAPGLRRRLLLRDGWTCLMRAGHPAVGERLELSTYLDLSHALCSPRGEGSGVVDEALAALGRARRVTLRSRYFVAAALAVRQSDLVLTMPRRSGERLAELLGLRAHEPPPELALRPIEFLALWHERMDDAPAHRWFRQALFAANDDDLGVRSAARAGR